jgi:hypothetical protein
LRWEFGIWGPDNEDDKRAIFEGAYRNLLKLGAKPSDVAAALDHKARHWQNEPNKPKSISGLYLASLVRSWMYKTQAKTEYQEPEKDLEIDWQEVEDDAYKTYLDGSLWEVVRAGCSWLAERKDLDWSKFEDKARRKLQTTERRERERLQLGPSYAARFELDKRKVIQEAKRIAVEHYFGERKRRELGNAADHPVLEQTGSDAGLEEHNGSGSGP